MPYTPAQDRYSRMSYRRCGKSGLKLPAVSLGLWHNFGHDTPHATKRAICQAAFDHGSCLECGGNSLAAISEHWDLDLIRRRGQG